MKRLRPLLVIPKVVVVPGSLRCRPRYSTTDISFIVDVSRVKFLAPPSTDSTTRLRVQQSSSSFAVSGKHLPCILQRRENEEWPVSLAQNEVTTFTRDTVTTQIKLDAQAFSYGIFINNLGGGQKENRDLLLSYLSRMVSLAQLNPRHLTADQIRCTGISLRYLHQQSGRWIEGKQGFTVELPLGNGFFGAAGSSSPFLRNAK